jgi:hypothetical protein
VWNFMQLSFLVLLDRDLSGQARSLNNVCLIRSLLSSCLKITVTSQLKPAHTYTGVGVNWSPCISTSHHVYRIYRIMTSIFVPLKLNCPREFIKSFAKTFPALKRFLVPVKNYIRIYPA